MIEKSETIFIFIMLNSFVWAGTGQVINIDFLDVITVAFVIGVLMFVIRKSFDKMINSLGDERVENTTSTNKEIEITNVNEEENNFNSF